MKTGNRIISSRESPQAHPRQRKCCAHCPGVKLGQDSHDCLLPKYVRPSLGAGSNCKLPHVNGTRNELGKSEGEKRSPDGAATKANNASDRFATARKFHAENLQHQPLPDRVDDAIFTADGPAEQDCMCDVVKRCQKLVPRRAGGLNRGAKAGARESRVPRFAPALGCKKPETWMDLAICWETPVDPVYEPVWPTHIDGSEGGPAPAVFALVQHTESDTDVRDNSIPSQRAAANKTDEDKEAEDTADLCRDLDGLHLQTDTSSPAKYGVSSTARIKRARFNRHCCGPSQNHQRHTSASARPSSCLQKHGCQVIGRRCNGLASSNGTAGTNGVRIPRPRTPYARRSFCIDSLAPPFSLVHGCRDADYPEHWRLTSVYRQSYRNPARLRNARTLLLNC